MWKGDLAVAGAAAGRMENGKDWWRTQRYVREIKRNNQNTNSFRWKFVDRTEKETQNYKKEPMSTIDKGL